MASFPPNLGLSGTPRYVAGGNLIIVAGERSQVNRVGKSATMARAGFGQGWMSPKLAGILPVLDFAVRARRALTHSDADQFGAGELLRTRRAVIEFWARCSLSAGTSAFVERWIIRLIAWFLAPSRAK